MRRWLVSLTAAWALGVAGSSTATAGIMVSPAAGPARVANSDLVLVGKVTELESKDVQAGTQKYRIAVVQVDDPVRGGKALKTVRVGFLPLQPVAPPAADTIKVRPGVRPLRGVQLTVDQAGLFLLKKHATEDFYILGGPTGFFINRDNNPAFDKEVDAAKAIVKIASNPQTALQSNDAEERLLGAALLIENYRRFTGAGVAKQEPIDAAQSKQILLALANASWDAPAGATSLRPNPSTLFYRLGITQNDGWLAPRGGDVRSAMQAWLRDNCERYRIQQFVPADAK